MDLFFKKKPFLFFKIKSWNFQYLFEMEFRETSQNFNSFSLFRQLLFSFFLLVFWLNWNFARFHEILFHTDSESFLKRKYFKPLSISKQRNFVYWLNFQGRFWARRFTEIKMINLKHWLLSKSQQFNVEKKTIVEIHDKLRILTWLCTLNSCYYIYNIFP